MTLRLSTGLANAMTQSLGFSGAFNRLSCNIYSGAQPVSADAAVTGTLLGTVTQGSGALTQETQATGTITLSGAAGSVNTVTVGGLNIIGDVSSIPFNVSLAQTSSDLADAINRNGIYSAVAAAGVVTIKPRPGVGASHNAAVVTATLTTLTAVYANMAGGISSVNALIMGTPVGGIIQKPPTQVWSFNGLAAGTAGWFRFISSVADGGVLQVGNPYFSRLDGSIAVSGGDMALSNITVAVGVPNTIDTFKWTQPLA